MIFFSKILKKFFEKMQKLTLTHGKVLYIPDVFDKNLQDYYFNELSLLDWQTGGGIAYGKAYTLNRLIAGYDDNKFPEVIEVIRNHIRNKVKEYTGEHHLFDNVFMNLYQSGKNHIPMHRDNYEGEEGPIASVSLGAARFFDFCSIKGDVKHRTLNDEVVDKKEKLHWNPEVY